jgi:hypothetical protein
MRVIMVASLQSFEHGPYHARFERIPRYAARAAVRARRMMRGFSRRRAKIRAGTPGRGWILPKTHRNSVSPSGHA